MDVKQDRDCVVVGVDGSSQASNALRWAARLAPLLGADITVVHGTGLLDEAGGAVVPTHTRLDRIRSTVERDWCRTLGSWRHRSRIDVRECPAVDAIVATADEIDAGLVIVGTRGAGLAPAQAIGSTALQVLQRLVNTDVPALVVPGATDSPSVQLRRLLVGVDGSSASLAALAWAADLAALTGASCEVVAVVEGAPVFPIGPSPAATAEGEADAAERLRAMTHDWCEPLREAGVPHRVTIVSGAAAPTLVMTGRMLATDLVVVGSSGAGAAGDPLVGSVSRRVAHEAGRPVAVVPTGARLRPADRRVPAGAGSRAR